MRLWDWSKRNSLWLVGLGLMLASSGLDGVYMAMWMPVGWAWLGFVLNTTADICNPVLTYWYGRLQLDRSSRKRTLARVLLGAEVVAVGYSWLFGWRRLRTVLQVVEADDWRWVAPLAAGFIPLLLAFIGYAQSLLAGRIEEIQQPTASELKELENRLRTEFADTYAARRVAPVNMVREAMLRDGSHCYYCGVDMKDWPRDKIHIDHFYPRAEGGDDDPFNLVVSCESCNLSKHSQIPTEEQVWAFKVYLIDRQDISTKEKIWLVYDMGLTDSQKEISLALDVSASYVSSVLKKKPDELSESLLVLRERIESVGLPPDSVVDSRGNGHKEVVKEGA